MKPLIRWTIGERSTNQSFDVLSISIKLFKKNFNNFNHLICHNCTTENYIKKLNQISDNLDIELFRQSWGDCPVKDELPIVENKLSNVSSGSLWKFCPARLQLDTHEIIIDNDLIIADRLEKITQFLKSDSILICEDTFRFFGRYDNLHKEKIALNSGLIGLPPYYDFHNKLNTFWNENKKEKLSYADEQGLVMALLNSEPNIKITTNEISILHFDKFYDGKNWQCYSCFNFTPSGFHFVGINRRENHIAWNLFKQHYLAKLI